MWALLGLIVGLQYARGTVDLMQDEINDFYRRFVITRPLLELRNLGQVASLMNDCALSRKESRGLHFNSDPSRHPSSRNRYNIGSAPTHRSVIAMMRHCYTFQATTMQIANFFLDRSILRHYGRGLGSQSTKAKDR